MSSLQEAGVLCLCAGRKLVELASDGTEKVRIIYGRKERKL